MRHRVKVPVKKIPVTSSGHPSPFAYRKLPVPIEDDNIVGWFMVAFKKEPDHEYPFALFADGRIMPEIEDRSPEHLTMFARYLAEPDFHHAHFHQNSPISPDELSGLE